MKEGVTKGGARGAGRARREVQRGRGERCRVGVARGAGRWGEEFGRTGGQKGRVRG